jgi:hypothetical protein
MTVHDEIVVESALAKDVSVADMKSAMLKLPAWAKGLPLDTAGGKLTRYAK